MVAGLIYGIGGFIEALIGLRFVLKLLGANPDSGFVNFIYSWSLPFVAPFANVFGQDNTTTGTGVVVSSVFDWTALIAFIVIGIIVAILGRVFTHKTAA